MLKLWSVACMAGVAICLVGCATYEYELVQPADLAGHIGSKADRLVRRDPVVYRMRSYANRLVVRIENPSDQPITLVGAHSTVVDPEGQSHPLVTATIAPASYIRLVFPPVRPRIERIGPSFTIGGGYGYGRIGGDVLYEPPPRYYAVMDDGSIYWDWEGQTEIRVTFFFDRRGNSLDHSFTFRRSKM
jgi:hypothetical protein